MVLQLRADFQQRLLERAPGEPGLEIVGGTLQRIRGQAGRQGEHPVLHLAGLVHQHGQRASLAQIDELDMVQPLGPLRRHHQAGMAREARQQAARALEALFKRGARPGRKRLDIGALALGEPARLHDAVHEEAQAAVGRQPPGGGMGREQEAQLLEVRHHVADRGRRERPAELARERTRADRFARLHPGIHDQPEDLARARIEIGKSRRAGHATKTLPSGARRI